MSNNRVYATAVAALFTALTAVCSWISIPLPFTSVPINLATFAVILAGLVLGRKRSLMAIVVFLLLGAVGIPVFHGFTGGFGIVVGPTGGYLIGYLALAYIVAFTFDGKAALPKPSAADRSKGNTLSIDNLRVVIRYTALVVAGEEVLYALGTAWFMHLTGNTLAVAMTACVIPFIPGDIAKAILAYIVATRLRKAIN